MGNVESANGRRQAANEQWAMSNGQWVTIRTIGNVRQVSAIGNALGQQSSLKIPFTSINYIRLDSQLVELFAFFDLIPLL
jgi:hypothetical protein